MKRHKRALKEPREVVACHCSSAHRTAREGDTTVPALSREDVQVRQDKNRGSSDQLDPWPVENRLDCAEGPHCLPTTFGFLR